jgi:hypothetical protein
VRSFIADSSLRCAGGRSHVLRPPGTCRHRQGQRNQKPPLLDEFELELLDEFELELLDEFELELLDEFELELLDEFELELPA